MMLASSAAGPFLEPGNEKMFGSVRSIASSAVRALKYTTRQQADPSQCANGSGRERQGVTAAKAACSSFPTRQAKSRRCAR